MPVTHWDDCPKKASYPRVEVTIVSGEKVMINHARAKKGAVVRRHHHAAEQVFCLISGRARVQAGEEPVVEIGPGDVWYTLPDAEHQVDFLEDTFALEACAPIRMDSFAGYLPSHTSFTKQRDLAAPAKKGKGGGK